MEPGPHGKSRIHHTSRRQCLLAPPRLGSRLIFDLICMELRRFFSLRRRRRPLPHSPDRCSSSSDRLHIEDQTRHSLPLQASIKFNLPPNGGFIGFYGWQTGSGGFGDWRGGARGGLGLNGSLALKKRMPYMGFPVVRPQC